MTEKEIEEIREDMCGNYCMYSNLRVPKFLTEDYQNTLEAICVKCPMNRLRSSNGRATKFIRRLSEK